MVKQLTADHVKEVSAEAWRTRLLRTATTRSVLGHSHLESTSCPPERRPLEEMKEIKTDGSTIEIPWPTVDH